MRFGPGIASSTSIAPSIGKCSSRVMFSISTSRPPSRRDAGADQRRRASVVRSGRRARTRPRVTDGRSATIDEPEHRAHREPGVARRAGDARVGGTRRGSRPRASRRSAARSSPGSDMRRATSASNSSSVTSGGAAFAVARAVHHRDRGRHAAAEALGDHLHDRIVLRQVRAVPEQDSGSDRRGRRAARTAASGGVWSPARRSGMSGMTCSRPHAYPAHQTCATSPPRPDQEGRPCAYR